MSGFTVSLHTEPNPRFVERRGPDLTQSEDIEGYCFTHYLSRVTDERAPQPFVDGEIVCVWDGEIYDPPLENGDLIPLYRRHGDDFARHLDGEFAVALYDFHRRVAILATDAFGTKPLFRKGTEVASYRSALRGGQRVPPNTVQVVHLNDGGGRWRLVEPFDFDHQHKDSYDDWQAAFEQAVAKRAIDGCYIPLSAGYDSGGIDCALRQLGTSYKAYSIEGVENLETLSQRNSDEILTMDEAMVDEWLAFMRERTERATYRVTDFTGEYREFDMLEDKAPPGLAWIHSLASAEGRKVFLSGQGADEIIDARRHWPGYLFPEQLQQWPDFDSNFQVAYLMKEDYIGGTFGCEARYPFLDRAMVQEFLWLSPELKNRYYKAPLHVYMVSRDYPFDEQVKTGFLPIRE